MKIIGLLGGMSWESSAEYYRIINEAVRERLGGLHSAECLLYSLDFAPLERLQHEGRWDDVARELSIAAQRLERMGAEVILICTNSMHKCYPAIQQAIHSPVLHIADPTAAAISARGLHTVGLLGTRFTMAEDFYRGRLTEQHSLNVLVPNQEDQAQIHRIIYDELCLGRINAESRQCYREVIARLAQAGAEGIILGCTEIGLLVNAEDSPVPLFDTTRLHALAGVEFALA
jgi:aspartate racemase